MGRTDLIDLIKGAFGVFLLLLLFPGCETAMIEKIGVVTQLGVESGANHQVLVTRIFPNAKNKIEFQDELLSDQVHLLREGRENARKTASRQPQGGSLQQLMFSKELARQGLHDWLEIFEREPLDQARTAIVIVDGSPKQLLERTTEFRGKPRPDIYINSLLNANAWRYVPETPIYAFDIFDYAPGIDPIAPVLRLKENELQLTGTALFSNDKMVGTIDTQQSILLMAMMNRLKDANIIVRSNIKSGRAHPGNSKNGKALLVKKVASRMDVSVKSQKPVIKILLKMTVELKEFKWRSVPNDTAQKKLERDLSTALTGICIRTIKYTQQIGSDPLGIGDRLRAQHYRYWKKAKWPDDYRKADIRFTVRLKISDFGSIY